MENEDINKILSIVAFAILMQGDGGIITKSPRYVMEKYNRYYNIGDTFGLDVKNYQILCDYAKRWLEIDLLQYTG